MNEINSYTINQVDYSKILQINEMSFSCNVATLTVARLPGAGCSQCSRPV